MFATTQAFLDECENAKLKTRPAQTTPDGKADIVSMGVQGQNGAKYDVLFVFAESERDVSMRINRLAFCPEDKYLKVMDTVNELNGYYRWLKFFITKEMYVAAQEDAILPPGSAGKLCVTMFIRTMKMIDDIYPKIMKSTWSE